MSQRSNEWLQQALRDLEQAEDSKKGGRHEWACFIAQQAAEKAVKALHLYAHQEVWGHVIAKLLQELPDHAKAPMELIDRAKVLDNFYIPTRYPNSHPEGAPFEHYGPLQSEEAIRYASEVIKFVRSKMA
jgi:HEPN domain-containing protein